MPDANTRHGMRRAVNMWSYKDPWWVQCHGTFQNGVVFDITQGFVYGQLSKDQTHNSYVDIIGTKGIARMTHDFKTAVVDLRGVTQTHHIEKPFGGKNIDVLCDLFADSIETGIRNPQLRSYAIQPSHRNMHGPFCTMPIHMICLLSVNWRHLSKYGKEEEI